MNKRKSWQYVKFLKQPFAVAAGLTAMGAAQAAPINLGVPDWRLNADTTLRFNTGIRVEDRKDAIANGPTNSEAEYKFDQGDFVNARLDVLEEIDLSYQGRYGIRATGAGWYDAIYHDTEVATRPGTYNSSFDPGTGPIPVSVPYSETSSYFGNEYSSHTKHFYRGPYGELLDAFAFGIFSLGDTSLSVKAGKHTLYWGEGLFFGNQAISYSQAPVDGLKAVTSPGIETKEVFLPVAQLSANWQLTSNLSLGFEYFLDWSANRLPEGGTFLGPADMLYEGPDRFFTGVVIPGAFYGTANDQAVFLENRKADEPGPGGNYGVMMRYGLGEGQLGVYYRKFDETTPYNVFEVGPAPVNAFGLPLQSPEGGVVGGTYRLAYNRDASLVGLSYSQTLGGISFAGEASYRFDTALNNTGIDPTDHRGPTGDLFNANLDAILVLPSSMFYTTGQVIAEIAYTHLARISDHKELYNGDGGVGCSNKDTGCSTDNYVAAQVNFEPQWPQAFSGIDLSAPTSVQYGISGNYAGIGGGNEGSLSYSVGLKALFYQQHEVTLSYQDSYSRHLPETADGYYAGGSGAWMYNDRGRIVLTLKTSF